MRISDWSSDVCSSDLQAQFVDQCKVASHLIKYRINQQRLAVDFIGKQVGVGGRGGVEQLPENHSVPPLKLFSKRCIERPFIVIVMQGLDLPSMVRFKLSLMLKEFKLREIGRASCRERVCQYV